MRTGTRLSGNYEENLKKVDKKIIQPILLNLSDSGIMVNESVLPIHSFISEAIRRLHHDTHIAESLDIYSRVVGRDALV